MGGDPPEHRRRVETRAGDVPGLKLPDWDKVSARVYQPMDRVHARLDTASRTVEACVEDALRFLEA